MSETFKRYLPENDGIDMVEHANGEYYDAYDVDDRIAILQRINATLKRQNATLKSSLAEAQACLDEIATGD